MYDSPMNPTHGTTKPQKTAPKSVFLAATLVVFFLSLSAADSVGFVPDYIDGTNTEYETVAETLSEETVALSSLPELGPSTPVVEEIAVKPERLIISAIDLDLSIQNPGTRDIGELDALLKNGPARYVDSAMLGENGGNMIIFAHSSNLPVVRNQMYKAFNKVPTLVAGDTITIQADGKSYLYMVTSVKKADASDTRIDMSRTLGTRLTLVTCDTLTSKDARFVLEASFVGSYDI